MKAFYVYKKAEKQRKKFLREEVLDPEFDKLAGVD